MIPALGLVASVCLAQLQPRTSSGISSQASSDASPLPLDQAFPFYVSELGPGRLQVNWEIADAHYLYRHAFHFSLQQTPAGESIEVDFSLPDGLKKTDQFFGQIEAYYNEAKADLSLTTVPSPEAILVIQYQGCADWGFCYPPQRHEFRLRP